MNDEQSTDDSSYQDATPSEHATNLSKNDVSQDDASYEDAEFDSDAFTNLINVARDALRSNPSPPLNGTTTISTGYASGSAPTSPKDDVIIPKVDLKAFDGYKDLLNSLIDGLNSATSFDGALPLLGSFIGASFWTADEKNLFFEALSRYGPDNLPKLCEKLGSKSEAEVRFYILTLQAGLEGLTKRWRKAALPGSHSINLAYQIDEECEADMDVLAFHTEALVHRQISWREKAIYGQDWVIDAARADEIEERMTEKGSDQLEKNDDDRGDKYNAKNSGSHGLEHSMPGHSQSTELLRPALFIELMRNVFMNGGGDEALLLNDLLITTPDCNGPSIHRSAFEMFNDLTISLTRRIVQAAVFQATSRLRAVNDDRVQHMVRSVDVQTAVEILGMPKPRRYKYWRDAVKRYSLVLYSHAERFQHHGRHYSHFQGCRLTDDEVDEELREPSDAHASSRSEEKDVYGNIHVTSDDGESNDFQGSDDSQNRESDDSENQDDEHDEEFESIQQQQLNQEENNRLRELLGLEARRATESSAQILPRTAADVERSDWRKDTVYKAVWEQAKISTKHKRLSIDENDDYLVKRARTDN